MAGRYSHEEIRIKELQAALKKYRPGGKSRLASDLPKNPPEVTRIGLFGAPGVGKSALINSFLYVTGDMWNHEAAEGYIYQQAQTMKREAYNLTDHLVVCDNRGMAEFSKKYMEEVENQMSGARRDGDSVVWNRDFVNKIVTYLNMLKTSQSIRKQFEIHCAVIVVSAENMVVQASDLSDLIDTIRRLSGEPPIFVITHIGSAGYGVKSFKQGLCRLGVHFVHEIENYTYDNHFYDVKKHLDILEALNQCALVADKVLRHAENHDSGCNIL